MGYMRHHAIIVTGADYAREVLDAAHAEAQRLFPHVSPLIPSSMNGHWSFLVPPDGSKEGWEDSDVGDARRNALISLLNKHAYEDGSSSLDWCEVMYGDDEWDAAVPRYSEQHQHDVYVEKGYHTCAAAAPDRACRGYAERVGAKG